MKKIHSEWNKIDYRQNQLDKTELRSCGVIAYLIIEVLHVPVQTDAIFETQILMPLIFNFVHNMRMDEALVPRYVVIFQQLVRRNEVIIVLLHNWIIADPRRNPFEKS